MHLCYTFPRLDIQHKMSSSQTNGNTFTHLSTEWIFLFVHFFLFLKEPQRKFRGFFKRVNSQIPVCSTTTTTKHTKRLTQFKAS